MDFGSVENRKRLGAIRDRVIDRAIAVGGYAEDLETSGELKNANCLEDTLRDLGNLIKILLVTE